MSARRRCCRAEWRDRCATRLQTGTVPDDVNPEDYPPHLQWATDPAGRRYWIQGVPSFGFNPLVSVVKSLFSRTKAPATIEVGGVVMVTRVEGEQRTDVFELHCSTLDEARAKAVSLAGEIEAGTFKEQPTRGG